MKLECYKLHKVVRRLTKCGVINDVKLLRTVNRRIYCRKFLPYPIRCHDTKASALESTIINYSKTCVKRPLIIRQNKDLNEK